MLKRKQPLQASGDVRLQRGSEFSQLALDESLGDRHQSMQPECRIHTRPSARKLSVIDSQNQIRIEGLGGNLAGDEGNYNVTMLADWVG